MRNWPLSLYDAHALQLDALQDCSYNQHVGIQLHQREAVRATLEQFVTRLGLATARKLPVGLPADRPPTEADLRAIPPASSFVHFKLTQQRPGH